MTKKGFVLFLVMVFAMVMLLLPVSAEIPTDLADKVISSVDYRKESPLDITENLVFVNAVEDVTFAEYDGIICVDRASIDENNGFRMQYDPSKYQTLKEVYTVEAYVYMT